MAHELWEAHFYGQGAVAIALVAMAAVMFHLGRRRRSTQLFAVFLLLVAGSFGAEALRLYFYREMEAFSLSYKAHLVSRAFAYLDPALLAYLAARYPRRRGPARSPWGVAALMVAPLLLYADLFHYLATTPALSPNPRTVLHPMGFALYTASYYLGALGLIMSTWLSETDPQRRRAAQVFVVAFATVIVSRFPGFVYALLAPGFPRGPMLATAAGAYLAIFAAILWAQRDHRGEVLRVAGWTGLLVALLSVGWLISTPIDRELLAGSRWIVFTALVSYGMLRPHVVDIDLRLRRAAAAMVGVAVPVAAFGAATWAAVHLGGIRGDHLSVALGGLAAAVAVVPGISAARSVRRRLLPDPGELELFLRQRRAEVYTAALLRVLRAGEDPDEAPRLGELRDQLGLALRDHRELRSLAEVELRHGREPFAALREGVLVRGRYRVHRRLGDGRHARTYLASDEASGGTMVLKELKPEWVEDETVLARFHREAALLRTLRHEHVVGVRDAFEVGGGWCMVLEHMEGGSLADRLEHGAPPVDQAVAWTRHLLSGLHQLHDRGVVHRDIKPANLLLDDRAVLKVGDLGIAQVPVSATRSTHQGRHPGTLAYMSPEQARGEPVDRRSDLYAAGAVLYQLLTGRPPHDLSDLTDHQARVQVQTVAVDPAHPAVPSTLVPVLEQALALDPEDRYRSAQEMRDDLDRAVAHLPVRQT